MLTNKGQLAIIQLGVQEILYTLKKINTGRKNHMKKVVSLALSLLFILTLFAGCGDKIVLT